MVPSIMNTDSIKTTNYKVVLPFFLYAAISFLVGAILLLTSSEAFQGYYFQPHILAITHTMALGWGTMIIVGAGHQLVPVLIEGKLFSDTLGYISFISAAIGIPILIYGFYIFDLDTIAKWGAKIVILSFISFLTNIIISMIQSKKKNVHAIFVVTATFWLLFTSLFGLILLYNFKDGILPSISLDYLVVHAHWGIVGWFLLLVIGVASRLIPLFMISKYNDTKQLWIIFGLINFALILHLFVFNLEDKNILLLSPTILVLVAVGLFMKYCYTAYKQRLRKQVDEQVKISLLSVFMLCIPVIILFFITGILLLSNTENSKLILTYGFVIFFGWITAIILGMTFKTMPFVVWNKVYRKRSVMSKTPSPKDLFNNNIFKIMSIAYIFGFLGFTIGILTSFLILLNIGAGLLIITAALYNWNVFKVISHKAKTI